MTIKPESKPGILSRLSLWQQMVLVIACLGLATLVLWRWSRPEVVNGHVPADFPNVWIAAEDAGHADRIVIIPGRTEPSAPVERDGKKLYPAYHCLNEKCPGHGGDQTNVFAGRQCPRCKTVDPNLVQRHNTPEGEAMLVEIRRAFAQ